MQFWYTENHTPQVRLSLQVDKQLYSGKSEFQRIDVFESKEIGRFLTIDGFMMVTEKDEFIYHEMMVHVPMAVSGHIKNALIIGAGDGGIVRELARYKNIETIDLVEIDSLVIEVSKKYLPSIACCFDDKRVSVFNEDGSKFIKNVSDKYDLIIVDSTDPIGPGEGLFSNDFYRDCFRALKSDGIMVNQHESPFYNEDAVVAQRTHRRIADVFPIAKVYQAHIPTYSSGHWLFGFASKKLHPTRDLDAAKWNALGIETQYYNTPLHIGSFALPNYVLKLLKDDITLDK